MTPTIMTPAQELRNTFDGMIRLLDDGVEATIARERRELEQFRTRSRNMFDYIPVTVSLAVEKTPEAKSIKACLVTLLDGDYDGATSYTPGEPANAEVARLKGVGKRLYELLQAAGLRPTLDVENRFNRGNGKRYDYLCIFIEVDPSAYK
jgi:hypothetical protein